MKTIKFQEKEYQIPERMGLLPVKTFKMIQAISVTDVDIDFKQLSLILKEPIDFLMNLPAEEYLKLSKEVYGILLSEVKPELLEHINFDEEAAEKDEVEKQYKSSTL
jgi:hypothetical protein